MNQYGRFSSVVGHISQPLRELLCKDTPWVWLEPQKLAFSRLKDEFRQTPVLAPYSPDRVTYLSTDASDYGLGAILSQQQPDGSRKLVAAAGRSLSDTEQRYAVIEKEALGVTWGMEKFARYLIGISDLTIETDHKPLVSLLGEQEISKLPARIQRFRLKLLRFVYKIKHIPGKENVSADAMSRYPRDTPTELDVTFVDQVEDYSNQTMVMPSVDIHLEKLHTAQKSDEVLCQVIKYVQTGWPHYLSSTDTVLKPYFENRAFITICNNLLAYQNRVIMPQTARLEALRSLHEGHLGLTKCTERARASMWWPRMSYDIEEMVKNCRVCKESAPTVKEPLLPTATPSRPWQIVGTDLFYHNRNTYLLVTDYYSRYPEIAMLTSESSSCVIKHLKSIFARHGIPEMVMSDNGPQYASQEFKDFAEKYHFRSVTSSPKYPRANGAAERMVQTVKNILKKSEDPYIGLLAYRTSPIQGGLSPAELLMNRRLRSTIAQIDYPITTTETHKQFQRSNNEYKVKMKQQHDSCSKVKELPTLTPGDDVYIRDLDRNGTVKQVLPGRTYVVEAGNDIRRNRSSLVSASKSPTAIDNSNNSDTANVEATPRPKRQIRPPRRLIEEC